LRSPAEGYSQGEEEEAFHHSAFVNVRKAVGIPSLDTLVTAWEPLSWTLICALPL
jgi:hypothetical protein